MFLDFKCALNEDCNGHGVCDETGACQCQAKWNGKADCSGKICSNHCCCLKINKLSYNTILFFKTISEFACLRNADCNGQGTCENGKCICNPEWDAKEDCTGNFLF